ncbi:hypothetical protein [Salinilacihabitans rarus]|uniref:hypothetical protein n=1 Tax=Salinilacihabitans rarus TaxID=2961596 RepID=UPI0020C879A4|nr:hypothetical protein [Salinilacihabitans rarus]
MTVPRLDALRDAFLAAPVESSLVALAPLALAACQLANSYVNGLPALPAVGFAVAMVAFAAVAMGLREAETRRRRLERDLRRV